MLTVQEIKLFLDEDAASQLKQQAREGQKYYDGEHDIKDLRMFYWNADGNLVEDETRSNAKIPHQFFSELVDQGTEHILSGSEAIVRSDDPELQAELDIYFNDNETFMAELAETITGQQAKGFDYMYAYKGEDDRLCFENADCIGVVEVEGRFADDGKDQVIYKYVDRIDKEGKTQFKILVIDDEATHYFRQEDSGDIEIDDTVPVNPRPHALYTDDKGKLFTKPFGALPVFRLDNNKKKTSWLKPVKSLIDDYDIMASSLTNNLIDFDTPLHVVKGFEGDNLDELQTNWKTKKIIGVSEDGGVEVQTVNIPFEARKAKLEIDEKAIYRFGMGLNMQGLRDTSATTNMAIKAAYSLLDLRCKKLIREIKKFLRKILKLVLAEINEKNGTDYQMSQVWFDFTAETITNDSENAQIELTEAQKRQTDINTLLSLEPYLGNELMMQNVAEVLDLDYEQIKSKLPEPEEAKTELNGAIEVLEGVDPEGGGVVE